MTEDREQKKPNNLPSSVFRSPSSVLNHLIFWSIFAGGLTLDLWSKSIVFNWLADSTEPRSIIKGFLYFQLALNEGAAFGIAQGQRILLVSVSAAAIAIILSVFLFAGTHRKITVIALALFAAGVCGNLYDRLFNDGKVRDFIDVIYWSGKHWPSFNVADSMLCIAVGLLILSSIFTGQSSQKHAQQQK
jgi:signal peptidase II